MPASLGTHDVCVTAVNIGAGHDVVLGCSSVTLIDHTVVGNVDRVIGGTESVTVRGWAADRDTSAPLSLLVRVDDVTLQVSTGVSRPDVQRVFPELGSETGYAVAVPTTAGDHSVCVTARNVGPGSDRTFPCTTVTVAAAAPAPSGRTVYEGDLHVTQPGAVVDSLDIHGFLRIKAANVTVKNTIVRGRNGLTVGHRTGDQHQPGPDDRRLRARRHLPHRPTSTGSSATTPPSPGSTSTV